jgi:RNA methyltransferase, TrmH family
VERHLEQITSLKNPRIKSAIKLRDKKERNLRSAFAFEGAREISRAINSGFEIEELFCCESLLSREAKEVILLVESSALVGISEEVFAKMATREKADGLWAVIRNKEMNLSDIQMPDSPLLLGVHGGEKPGNLGALFRTADGIGANGVICLEGTSSPFNHNTIRTSLGTVFSVPSAAAKDSEILDFCRKQGIQIVAAALSERSVPYTNIDFKKPTLIVVGAEDKGLPKDWLDNSDFNVQIPMNGIADSLNVSVAGAVLMYEALRQRG